MTLVESAVDTLESALCAERAGAGRIELCAGLNDAGTTPSAGLIAAAAERCRIPVFVLVRPRGGGFVYSDADLDVMIRDVVTARSLGASGIVVGALDSSAKVDLPKTRELVRAAKDLPVTFHRAFDLVGNLGEALDRLIEIGVARVLTSGGSNTAMEGAPRIAALIKQAAGRIGIIAGGGVRENNVREIITLSGAKEVHARISSIVCGAGPARSSLRLRKRLPDNEGAWEELDESRMRDLVQQAG